MKKLTKILSLSLAFMLSLATAIPTVSVAADPNTGSITITSYKANNYTGDKPGQTLTKGSLNGRTFVAYRILDGETVDGTHVGYTIPDVMEKFYQEWNWGSTTPNTGIEPVAANNMLRIAEVDDVSTSQQSVVQSDNAMSGIDIMKAIANLDGQVQFVGPVESSDSGIMLMDSLGSGVTGDYLDEAVLERLNSTTENSDTLYAFANSALAYAKKANEKYSSSFIEYKVEVKTDTNEAKIENLPYGYYVVGEKTGNKVGEAISTALLTAIHTESNIDIVTKDVAPTVNKFITEKADDSSLDKGKKKNSAEIGDTVNFKIVANLPDVQGYSSYTYTVEDTFVNGLKNNNDAKVYFYESTGSTADEITADKEFKGNKIITVVNTDNTLTITFDSAWIIENGINSVANTHTHTASTAPAAPINIPYIVITYSAEVISSATIGGDGNVNKVGITYSNNPSDSSSITTTPPGTEESTTTTYVYGVDLYKTGYVKDSAIGSKAPLEGATFKLINRNAGDNKDKYATLNKAGNTYTLTGWTDVDSDSTTTITSTKNPESVRINGLEAGNYEFEEISAPTGYEPIKGEGAIAFTITATDPANPSFGETGDSSLVTVVASGTIGVGKVEVENIIDGLLPGTGGVGRVMVYALGSILVLGAAVLFVLKRRSGKNA